MESSNMIELEVSESLTSKGFRIIKDGLTIVLEDRDGSQARSSIYTKDWTKTIRQFEKNLEKSQIVKDRLTQQEILTCLSRNYNKIVANGSAAVTSSSGAATTTQAETPIEKLNDMSFEEWQTQLLTRYQKLQDAIKESTMPLRNLWIPLDFALSIKSILHIGDVKEPFAGILLAPPSSLKTVTIDLFRKYWRAYYTHYFTPRSIVSHNTSLSEEVLRDKVDMLPQIKNKFLLTPELGPIFSAKEEDLKQMFAILSAVLDGKGYQSNSGGFGQRGYDGEHNFMWLGAVVDISYNTYKVMGNLGPKVHFLRLPWTDRTEEELIQQTMDGRFQSDHDKIQAELYDYLKWFEACPLMTEDKTSIPKIEWDTSKNERNAVKYIARLAKLLGRLRGVVETWETSGTQGSDYAYNLGKIEEADRANRQLTNLARGHALSQGRNYLTRDDIPLLVKVVLSTAPLERVAVFDLLLKHDGRLETQQIMDELRVSPHTAHRVMTELYALDIVDRQKEGNFDNSKMTIELKNAFRWGLGRAFLQLRKGLSLSRISSNNASFDKKSSDRADNVESDSAKHEEKRSPHPHNLFFWERYDLLAKQKQTQGPEGTVSESALKQDLVSSGKFNAGEAIQLIKEMITRDELSKLGFDVLSKNSPSEMSINGGK